MPENDSFPGLDKGEYGLHPVKTDRLMGLILVCLEGNPQPVSEMFAPFMADLEPYRIQDMQPIGVPYEEVWQANWKIAMDNYLESYHVPIGHPGLNRMFTPDYIGQIRTPEGVGYGVGQYHPTYSPKWGEREYQKLSPKVATHLPEGHRKRWRYFSVLPNMGIDVFPDQIDFFQVIPDGFGRTRIRGANFALPDDRREMKLLRYLNSRINRLVQREDAFLCDRVQKGIVTTGYQPGPLSEYEVCVKQFHDMIRERIPETRLSKAPASLRPGVAAAAAARGKALTSVVRWVARNSVWRRMSGTAVISQNAPLVSGPMANSRREIAPLAFFSAQVPVTSSPNLSGSGRTMPLASRSRTSGSATRS